MVGPPYPIDVETGIGQLINLGSPVVPGVDGFSLHDHAYIAPYVPDPSRAVVTYVFDEAIVVNQIHVVQHSNGIQEIQASVGNSLGSLSSIGTVNIGSGPYEEMSTSVFDFQNSVAGRYLQLTVTRTSLVDGWASYRALLVASNGTVLQAVPEPTTLALIGLACLPIFRKRK